MSNESINRAIRARLGTSVTLTTGASASSSDFNRMLRRAAGRHVAEPESPVEPEPEFIPDGERDRAPAAFVDLGGGPRGTTPRAPRQTDYNALIRAGARKARSTRGGIDLADLDAFDL